MLHLSQHKHCKICLNNIPCRKMQSQNSKLNCHNFCQAFIIVARIYAQIDHTRKIIYGKSAYCVSFSSNFTPVIQLLCDVLGQVSYFDNQKPVGQLINFCEILRNMANNLCVVVLTPNGRRNTVKCNANTTILQVQMFFLLSSKV